MIGPSFGTIAIKKLERELKTYDRAVSKAQVRALRKTSKTLRAESVRRVREDLNVKAGALRKAIVDLRKPRPTDLRASIGVTQQHFALHHFSPQQKKAGVSVKVYRKKPRKIVKGAFLPIGELKGKGVFLRKTEGGKRVGRLPIRKQWGPSVVLVFRRLLPAVVDYADRALLRNLDHEIDYATRGR